MVNGRATASGEKGIDLSEGIAWFGDILNIDGPLVEIVPRSIFANEFGCRCQAVASEEASAHVLTLLVGRVPAWGERTVASESKGREPVVREKRQNKANLPVVLIIGIL
jgi:hypothetical protein